MATATATGTTTSSGTEEGKLHIVMLPWLALGHILPFLELSKRIAMEGHRVSFLCTTKNIERLAKIPPNLTHLIELISLPLPTIPNLPETAEATVDLPNQELRPYLRIAYDGLEHHLRSFLLEKSNGGSLPDWVVFDYAPYWAPRVAAEFDVPSAFLGLFSASVLAFNGPASELLASNSGSRAKAEDYTVKPKWIPFPSTVAYKDWEIRMMFKAELIPDASGVSEGYRFGASIQDCQVAVVRSCTEFEEDWLELLGKLYKKPIIPVGFITPSVKCAGIKGDSNSSWYETSQWLDKQQQRSVVYAAFGSESKLNKEELLQIATGLELSKLRFVWVVNSTSDDIDLMLDEFKGRVGDRGIIIKDWAPQVEILAHPAVGGFLTHCGWNSIIEGLGSGVVLALLPLMFDQGLNCRILEEMRVGIEVKRNEEDGSFTGRDIAETLRLVMVEKGGEMCRAKAMEARNVFGNEELQDGYIREFLRSLKEHKTRRL